MTPTAASVRRALASVLEGRALNREQTRALYNPDPAANSLVEHLLDLRRHGVPVTVIRRLIDQVAHVLRLNAAEGSCENTVAGQLDEIAHALHDAECNDELHQSLSIKTTARVLRSPLARLDVAESITYFTACSAIKDAMRHTTPEQLRSKTLRHELGAGPHDRLLDFLAITEEVSR